MVRTETGTHIRRVTDRASLESLYRFRYRVYVDEFKWLRGQGGVLVDDFDASAHNYAAYDDRGEVVGSVRVVLDGPLGLPLEHCCPLHDFREGRHIAEISRLAVSPEHRGGRLGALLMKAGYQCCAALGVTHITLDTYVGHEVAGELYERMGFQRLGGPYYDSSYNCELPVLALVLDLTRARDEMPSRHPALFRYFTRPDSAIELGLPTCTPHQ